MEIFEKVRELGEMIRDSEEMKLMQELEVKHENDDEARELMKEFNMNRVNLARDMQSGKITREEAIKKNDEAFDAMCEKSPVIRQYIDAKKKFDSMVNQINQILNYYITGTDPSCTHDCSTCGGCG